MVGHVEDMLGGKWQEAQLFPQHLVDELDGFEGEEAVVHELGGR